MYILEKAELFATGAHDGQVRKYSGEPYIEHPRRVVEILRSIELTDQGMYITDDMLAAAWLHDTIEDCGVTYGEIEHEFGEHVAHLVLWLTDDKTIEGNRAYRKTKAAERLAQAPWEAQTIKCADLIDNTSDIARHDPTFARVYLTEKKNLLYVMDRALDKMQVRAYRALIEAERMLNA